MLTGQAPPGGGRRHALEQLSGGHTARDGLRECRQLLSVVPAADQQRDSKYDCHGHSELERHKHAGAGDVDAAAGARIDHARSDIDGWNERQLLRDRRDRVAPVTDTIFQVTSSHPTIAQVNNSVMIPSGVTRAGSNLHNPGDHADPRHHLGLWWRRDQIGNFDGQSRRDAPPSATLSSFTVNPTSVIGGNPSTGHLTLPAPRRRAAVSSH